MKNLIVLSLLCLSVFALNDLEIIENTLTKVLERNNLKQQDNLSRNAFEIALELVLQFAGDKTSSSIPQISDKEVLQQFFNGIFEQNKLADPTTIVQCFDDDSAHKTTVFAKQLLDTAAKGSISDLIGLKDLVQKFGNQLPQAVKDCLGDNAEIKALGEKYGIDDKTDPSVIEKKIITYLTLHYLTVHKWLVDLDNNWNAGKYYNVGFNLGMYGHTILGLNYIPNLSDKEILQELLNGVFEQNSLPDPTTVVPCFDDATAHNTVKFIGELLHKAAKGSVSDLLALKDLIQKFGDSVPKEVKDCLSQSTEFQALGKKYGITEQTDMDKLTKKIISYVTLHYLTVHKWLGELDSQWSSGKPKQVGHDLAAHAHTVIG